MSRPVALDLCSGAGGAAVGYRNAGFDVVGVDINPQPNYPFEFHQGDAVDFVQRHGREFDLIHASWPCQRYSAPTKGSNGWCETDNPHPDMIPPGRVAMLATGRPYVIENVQGAPIRRDLTLCGEMFGLGVIRHRWFEIHGMSVPQPPHVKHRGRVRGWRHKTWHDGPYVQVHGKGGGKANLLEASTAMGIQWMTLPEIVEAIPPAYTEHIGRVLMAAPIFVSQNKETTR